LNEEATLGQIIALDSFMAQRDYLKINGANYRKNSKAADRMIRIKQLAKHPLKGLGLMATK
jgi:hypothetical protein